MSVFVILLVPCCCSSVRLSLKLIKGNLLTYLHTYGFLYSYTSTFMKSHLSRYQQHQFMGIADVAINGQIFKLA